MAQSTRAVEKGKNMSTPNLIDVMDYFLAEATDNALSERHASFSAESAHFVATTYRLRARWARLTDRKELSEEMEYYAKQWDVIANRA